jgi:hypothetical protein
MGNKASIQASSQTSSQACSRRIKEYVNYRSKDKGKFMTAEQLLDTENPYNQHVSIGDCDRGNDGDDGVEGLGSQVTDIIELKKMVFLIGEFILVVILSHF